MRFAATSNRARWSRLVSFTPWRAFEGNYSQRDVQQEIRRRLKVFPELRVGLAHGKLSSAEKAATMAAFKAGELQLLVATTVIEVGVDVPNATAMVIEDANRFGLSQLHQLRGRVGRGSTQSFCVLVGDATNEEARARMEIMVLTTDGFKIAEEDLRIRGPGELMGTKQAGALEFKLADLIQDSKQLEVSRLAAIELIESDPKLANYPAILERAKERWTTEAAIVVS